MEITQPLAERAIVNVQAPGDKKNPSVLWLKYKLNIGNWLVGCYKILPFEKCAEH